MIKVLVKKMPTKTDVKQQKQVINEWNSIIVSAHPFSEIKVVSAKDFLRKNDSTTPKKST
jgi:hypothetical protein